jgi:hypothetical protein
MELPDACKKTLVHAIGAVVRVVTSMRTSQDGTRVSRDAHADI